MSYTHPATPVALTPITVSFYTVNIADNIVYFRGLLPSPGGAGKALISSDVDTAGWLAPGTEGHPLRIVSGVPGYAQLGTVGLADSAVTTAKILDGTIVNGDISDTAAIAFTKLAAVPVTKSGDTGVGSLAFGSTKQIAFATENGTKIDLAGNGQYLLAVAANVLKLVTGRDLEIWNHGAGGASLVYNTATHTMTINGQTVIHTGSTGGVSAAMLAGGAAATNLGYTPARIASGTYTGNGSTSGRQIATGFAVKLVIVHDSALDVSYTAINTTNSMRLATGNSVQGAAAVHVHASDGFVVGDGSVQGNVNTNTYSYTAIG